MNIQSYRHTIEWVYNVHRQKFDVQLTSNQGHPIDIHHQTSNWCRFEVKVLIMYIRSLRYYYTVNIIHTCIHIYILYRHMYIYIYIYNRQKAVSAYFTSKLILLFGSARQYRLHIHRGKRFSLISQWILNKLVWNFTSAISCHVATTLEM